MEEECIIRFYTTPDEVHRSLEDLLNSKHEIPVSEGVCDLSSSPIEERGKIFEKLTEIRTLVRCFLLAAACF